MSKIFVIGFNKTGTRTIHNYFQMNGIPSLHWEYRRLAKRILANDLEDKPLLEGYDNYTVYSDMEDHINLNYAHVTYFKLLDIQYPNSKFILNIRDVENWIKSRNNHMDGKYAEYLCYRLEINRDVLNDLWREEFCEHYNNVVEYFMDTNKLLIFDIERDTVEKLNAFFPEHKLDSKKYTHEGKTIL